MNNNANLFVVGAAKSGSSAICNFLNQSKEVYVPDIKEPRFYVSEHLRNSSDQDPLKKHILKNSTLTRTSYESLYKNHNEKYKLDGSVHYLYNHDEAIPQIKHDCEDAKIIIILREPIGRALSNYRFLSQYVSYDFESCLENENIAIENNFNSFWFYFNQGHYSSQVKAYMENFENVHVCFYEDFVASPLLFMKDIYDFLEIESNEIKIENNKKVNITQTPRNKVLSKLHRQYVAMGGRLPNFKFKNNIKKILFKSEPSNIKNINYHQFANVFTDDIAELERITNLDFTRWKNV